MGCRTAVVEMDSLFGCRIHKCNITSFTYILHHIICRKQHLRAHAGRALCVAFQWKILPLAWLPRYGGSKRYGHEVVHCGYIHRLNSSCRLQALLWCTVGTLILWCTVGIHTDCIAAAVCRRSSVKDGAHCPYSTALLPLA
jgi:hypothetical protein